MKILFIPVIALIALFFIAINYYIGLRGWQTLGKSVPFMNRKFYWLLFWFIALSFIIARFVGRILPGRIGEKFDLLGAYWLAAMSYFILIIILIDLIRGIDRRAGFIPQQIKNSQLTPLIAGLSVLLTVALILIYGTWSTQSPWINRYNITVSKNPGGMDKLHIVMISDIHLGTIVHKDHLDKTVHMINSLKPDVVLIGGDIIDDSIIPFAEQNMSDDFKNIQSKYGVFAILGNHDYYGGYADQLERYLSEAGVQVLRDRSVKVNDSFYIVGREDLTNEQRAGGKKRKTVSGLTESMDKSLPVILMDHQPYHLEEAQNSGVDLQLSGHTHKGQLFPFNYMTKLLYEKYYGYLQKGNLHVIVSSGIGTWGPPIRTGSRAEIVDVTMNFSKP